MELKGSCTFAYRHRLESSHANLRGGGGRLASMLACFPILAGAASPQSSSYKSTFTFPNALPGETIEVEKICDPAAGTLRLTSNSQYIQSGNDLARLEQQEESILRKKHGALAHSPLLPKIDALQAGGKLEVLVTLREPDGVVYLDKTKHSAEEMRLQSLSLLTLQPVVSISTLLARHGLKSKAEWSSRIFRAEVTRTELEKLAFDADVASLDEVPPQGHPLGFPYPDLGSMARSAYNHSNAPVPSGAGYGVNAATFETGIDPTMISCWGGLNPARIDQRTIPWNFWDHSHQTFRCLMVAAPAANLWHHIAPTLKYHTEDSYIIGNGIQTMSLSYPEGDPVTSTEMRYIDDLAYRSPFPVFCNPASNYGYQLAPDWECYNALNVGNVRHTNQTHWELVDTTNPSGGCTQTTNPTAIYGSRNDRELPMLVAPGLSSSTSYPELESCTNTTGWCGTSWSAPIVNGLAADVIAADLRMVNWPEKVRVALLVTAQNVDRGYWSYTSDGRDGAGVVHGGDAVSFAQNHATVFTNGTAVISGMTATSLYPTDFNDINPIFYKIQIPNPKPSGKHLRVVLTWDSNPGMSTSINPLSDLDLLVTSGSQGMASNSLNSNVEMVDIPNTMFTPGSIVDARIFKTTNRIPTGSRSQSFYYAIGWTWVKDHAD